MSYTDDNIHIVFTDDKEENGMEMKRKMLFAIGIEKRKKNMSDINTKHIE